MGGIGPLLAGVFPVYAVDHVGGVLTVIFVATLVLAINRLPSYCFDTPTIVLASAAVAAIATFALWEPHRAHPLFDLVALPSAQRTSVIEQQATLPATRSGRFADLSQDSG